MQRSYYRCTNSKCSVKKRVERCTEDPSLVVTTYEGQHTHHSPALLRGSILPDPNYPLSTATHVSFVPWQSSPINPSLHFTSTLAHSQLIRNPFLSPANVLYGFPQMSTPLSFPSLVHHLPITGALARDNAEKTLIVQGECVQGNVNKSKHTDFMQEIEASEHQHHHQRRFSHGRTPHAASATVESTPLIDKGLLDDMLPHRPCMRNTSPPTPSP
ncbi:hypothetical protein GOP47_0010951 [Adiantum capillus-veneris]|uniref:WRKY domain-containing protein n=1 Tax=Adiantum capillus-veneris TaxID=13818 RepID=A0A9D4UWB1_ADICA|nr:hypothetical protein GOP47_0010951 [Adiantum capillus-veneris]